MTDALAGYEFKTSGGDLFTNFTSGETVKLRVLTVDPLIVLDKFGNTKFAFIIWNYNESKAQILNKGATVAKAIQALHLNKDWGNNIQAIDIGITATGEGMDTRYSVIPYPNSVTLSNDKIEEARKIDLNKVFPGAIRMSEAAKGAKPVSEDQLLKPITAENISEIFPENDSQEIDLSEIPF